ncbi:hypothetical protein F7725_020848 [Dissostichus mawsoni]|uniref:Uncharacterized protein n=1 Tax=Dissostichus mawsoni TaxID=36200 RepID=A0A7J5YEH1_DISMA|nr:hypothetical protein F7725_020848 [Dissostichus mawsoni]
METEEREAGGGEEETSPERDGEEKMERGKRENAGEGTKGKEIHRRRPPARPSSGFLKPSSDDEDSGPRNASMQTSKKSSNPRESASFEKPQQERERDPGKTVTAPTDGPTGNKASASRLNSSGDEHSPWAACAHSV